MRLNLNLNDFAKIKRFAQKVVTFEDEVVINKNDSIYNAKSIISLIVLLDFSNSLSVEIISQNRNEIERFEDEMKEFVI